MIRKVNSKGERVAIWFSSILRWSLGILITGLGFNFLREDYAWVMILFGAIIFATGFFRPKRCLDENQDQRTGA